LGIRVVLAAVLLALWPSTALAQSTDATRIRAAFLKLIDRPRVPLAPESRPRLDSGFYLAEHFTFASESKERVPGIFLKSVRARDRRPAGTSARGAQPRRIIDPSSWTAPPHSETQQVSRNSAWDCRHLRTETAD